MAQKRENMIRRKAMTMLLSLACIAVFGVTIYADTITFDVTVTQSGTNEDNYSRKVPKAGGTSYENLFVVTAHSFPQEGNMHVYSRQENDSHMTSYPVQLSPSILHKSRNSVYVGDAPAWQIYRLHAYYGNSNTGVVQCRGNFTP